MVWRNRIILAILMVMTSIVSCQSNKKNNHENREDIDSISLIRMETLKKYGYKIPNNELFRNRINNIFKINIDDYFEKNQTYTGIVLERNEMCKILIPKYGYIDESTWQPEVYLDYNYIYWNDEEVGELSFYHLNSYLIYNNLVSFQYLKSKRLYLFELVSEFGYIQDKKLVDYALGLIGEKLEKINNDTALSLFIGSDGLYGKKQLRKALIEEYLIQYPNTEYLFFNLSESILDKYDEEYITIYEGDRYSDAGFLLEKELIQTHRKDQLINGGVDYIFDKNKEFLEWSKSQNAYTKIKEYANKIYLPCYERETGNGYECEKPSIAIIQDPDGYSNLRESANSSSKIIQKVKSGSEIDILNKDGDWWKISTEDGTVGYVHKSRIILEL